MDSKTLLAIMAAIIYSGADDCEKSSGYDAVGAVKKAQAILTVVYGEENTSMEETSAGKEQKQPHQD